MKLEWACIIRALSEGNQRCSVSEFALSLRMVRRYDCRESVAASHDDDDDDSYESHLDASTP